MRTSYFSYRKYRTGCCNNPCYNSYALNFFIKMESRAETAVKSEIIFYTTKTWFGICRQKRNKNVCNYEKDFTITTAYVCDFDVHSV